MAMKALEEKILAKVETSLAEMRHDIQQTKSTVSTHIIPMVQNIATEQKDLCSRVEVLSIDAFESRSDLIAQIDDINREALEARADVLASFEELEMKMNLSSPAVRELEFLETQLDQDLEAQAMFDFGSAQHDGLETLKEEVCALNQKHTVAAHEAAPPSSRAAPNQSQAIEDKEHTKTACDVDSSVQLSSRKQKVASHQGVVASSHTELDQNRPFQDAERHKTACEVDLLDRPSSKTRHAQDEKGPDSCLQWSKEKFADASDGWNSRFAGAFYSSKMTISPPPGAMLEKKSLVGTPMFDKKSVPFAPGFNVHRPRPSARLTSCHSMPVLAPLF